MFGLQIRAFDARSHHPTVRVFFNRGRRTTIAHVSSELFAECVGEHLQSLVEREFFCLLLGGFLSPLAFPRAKNLAENQRAILLLQGEELRESVPDGKPCRVARVNAGHERIDRVIEKFLSEMSHDKLGDALLNIVWRPAREDFGEQVEFGRDREQRRSEKLLRLSRNEHRVAAPYDVTVFRRWIGIKPARFEAQIANKVR